jgi:hypothetical protein
MRRLFVMLMIILFSAGMASALTQKQIDKYLRNHKEDGYKFLRSEGKSTWYVSFKLPEWESEWSVVIILLKNDEGSEVIGVGTTVYKSDNEPPKALMTYLMERNVDDMNIGSFGLYKDSESKKYMVQYWVKIPNQYVKDEQVVYSVGFVSGYANALEPEIKKYFSEE